MPARASLFMPAKAQSMIAKGVQMLIKERPHCLNCRGGGEEKGVCVETVTGADVVLIHRENGSKKQKQQKRTFKIIWE